jgi:hypothetical protein
MTNMSDQSNERKARAEEKQAQAETKAQSAREAMADYRARETAADDNVNRLKALRLARDAEASAEETKPPTAVPTGRGTKKARAPDEGLRPDQLTTENDG